MSEPDNPPIDSCANSTLETGPSWLARFRGSRPGVYRVVIGITWLVLDRVLRMGVGLFVGVWIARYLGPSDFGLFNYAVTLVAMFAMFSTLGLESVVIRDLVRHPARANETLGTTVALKLAGGTGAMLLACLGAWLTDAGDTRCLILVAILSVAPIFAFSEAIEFYFRAEVQTKYGTWARNAGFLLMTGARIAMVLLHAPLWAFALTHTIESILVAIFYVVLFRYAGHSMKAWYPTWKRTRELFIDAWPQLVTSCAIVIYMRIGQLMLRHLASEHEVGIYAAALRISEVWTFIPMTIVATVFPAIIQSRERDRLLYLSRILRLFSLMVCLALIIAVPVALAARPITAAIYGSKYAGADAVLAVHIWSSLFVFWGVAQEPWNLAEGLMRLTLRRTLAGAVLNIVLNLLWIPRYGALGTAWSAVIAYALAGVFANLFDRSTRLVFILQMKSLLFTRYLFARG